AFGNFSSPSEGRQGGPGRRPNSIAVRGNGSGFSGYRYITGTVSLPSTQSLAGSSRADARRHVQVVLSTENVLTVRVDFPGQGGSVFVGPVDLKTIPGQAAIPSTFKFGFAASTGGAFDIHEVRSLIVQTVPPDLTVDTAHPDTFTAGGTGRFTLTVSNSAAA